MINGLCSHEELGSFIVDLPSGKSINDTSIWSKRVIFSGHPSTNVDLHDAPSKVVTKAYAPANGGFWDNPDGNPTPTDTDFASPWKRTPTPAAQRDEDATKDENGIISHRMADAPAPTSNPASSPATKNILSYTEPIIYPVPKSGYYCVAIIPLTVMDETKKGSFKRAATDVPTHPQYSGTILFRNVFNGQLPAAEYPKVNFYLALTLAYVVFGGAWGYLCFRHMSDLLPIQYYVSMLVGFLVIEMLAKWGE
jgi:Lung seven transmembrane receptor